ncbi:hypothetical protein EV182_008156, partial [Spiromyces aspiralis]
RPAPHHPQCPAAARHTPVLLRHVSRGSVPRRGPVPAEPGLRPRVRVHQAAPRQPQWQAARPPQRPVHHRPRPRPGHAHPDPHPGPAAATAGGGGGGRGRRRGGGLQDQGQRPEEGQTSAQPRSQPVHGRRPRPRPRRPQLAQACRQGRADPRRAAPPRGPRRGLHRTPLPRARPGQARQGLASLQTRRGPGVAGAAPRQCPPPVRARPRRSAAPVLRTDHAGRAARVRDWPAIPPVHRVAPAQARVLL